MLTSCSHFHAQEVKRSKAQQPNLKLAKMDVDFDHVVLQIKTYYNDFMETKCKNGEQKYTDLKHWMTNLPSDCP